MTEPGNALKRLLLSLSLLAVAAYSSFDLDLPRPLPATSPQDEFSAERAFIHVQAIAEEPHPVGSPANANVREYITARLKDLALTVRTQAFTFRARDRQQGVNVFTTIPGNGNSSNAVALVCHYDSVPGGPGASDDAAGVATLLETARALKAGPPLRNDLVLLFTDGEEAGLKGAKAFVQSSPLLKQIRVVLNFEARGVSGPVFMFETSEGNGRLIHELAKAALRPRANSLMYEVYRHMPNDTDLTVFKKAGVPGLNFGFIGEAQHYHGPTDDPAHLSKSSLQHEGSYALRLARGFGNADLSQLSGADAVYFDLFGRLLVRYPAALALPFALLAAVLFIARVVISFKHRGLSIMQLGSAVFFWTILPALIALLARWLVPPIRGFPEAPLWSAVFVTIALCIGSAAIFQRYLSREAAISGGLFWWMVLALVTAVTLPGASFLFVWPFLFGLAAWFFASRVANTWVQLTLLLFLAFPALILVTPLVRNFYLALGPSALFIPLILLVLELGVLSPQLQFILSHDK